MQRPLVRDNQLRTLSWRICGPPLTTGQCGAACSTKNASRPRTRYAYMWRPEGRADTVMYATQGHLHPLSGVTVIDYLVVSLWLDTGELAGCICDVGCLFALPESCIPKPDPSLATKTLRDVICRCNVREFRDILSRDIRVVMRLIRHCMASKLW